MKVQLSISTNLNEHVSVCVFINNKNCGSLCMIKRDFQELCNGLKTLYPDFEIREE